MTGLKSVRKSASGVVAVLCTVAAAGLSDASTASAAGARPLTVVGARPLTVVGATTAGLAITSTGPSLVSSITVATGSQDAKRVVATFAPLVDASTGTQYAVDKPTVALGRLAANTLAHVPLTAALPYTGTFTATLSLAHDGKHDPPVAITITRSLAPASFTIDAVQISSSSFDWPVEWREGKVLVTRAVVLNELAGKSGTLNEPVLVKASAKIGENVGESDAKVVATNVSPAQPGCRTRNDTIEVEPGRSCRVELTLELPRTAGQFDGTLRFTNPGSPPLETTMTIQLRRGLLSAVIVIALGLVVGLLVNVVFRKRRDRLERLANIGRTGNDLDQRVTVLTAGFRDADERTTHDELRALLAALADDVSGGSDTDTNMDARLAVLRLKVPIFVPWVVLRRAVLDAPVQDTALIDDVKAIRETLVGAETTAEEGTALTGRISDLKKKLLTQQTALVRNEIDRARADAAAWFPADVRQPIDAQLDRAAEAAAADEGAPELARRELVIAQGLVAHALRTRLEELLDTATPPGDMEPAAWAQLQVQVRATLAKLGVQPPDVALQTLREADLQLLRGIIDPASTKLREERIAIASSTSPKDKERASALDSILEKLDDARSASARGDLATAHTAFDQARNELDEAKTSGFLGAAVGAATMPELPPAPPSPAGPAVAVPSATVIPIADLRKIRAQLKWQGRILTVVALLVGIAVGLVALYVGKPTWGSIGDIILAFLWGAGVYQVSGALQQGFTGVRSALAG